MPVMLGDAASVPSRSALQSQPHAHFRVPGVATGTTKAARGSTTSHQTRVTSHVFLSPIIPALLPRALFAKGTQTPGVGGAVLFTGRWSPITGHGLSPLFPLDTTISPVSPLFPLDTKNRGYPPPRHDHPFHFGTLFRGRALGLSCTLAPFHFCTLQPSSSPILRGRPPANTRTLRATTSHGSRATSHVFLEFADASNDYYYCTYSKNVGAPTFLERAGLALLPRDQHCHMERLGETFRKTEARAETRASSGSGFSEGGARDKTPPSG
jgi:hypothetical protein